MPVPRSEPTRRLPPGARRTALLQVLLEQDDGLSVAELAPAVGLHPNTVRAHLDVLVRSGQVTRRSDARSARGRPREIFEVTGAATADRNYRLLAEVLSAGLAGGSGDPARRAVAAGRRWAETAEPGGPAPTGGTGGTRGTGGTGGTRGAGRTRGAGGTDDAGPVLAQDGPATDPLAPVLGMLRRSGFAPQLAADRATIRLRHCPFRELAVAHPGVVCGIHLGLIQGTLARTAPGTTATRLVPFVQPDLCLTELRHTVPRPAERRPPGPRRTEPRHTGLRGPELPPGGGTSRDAVSP